MRKWICIDGCDDSTCFVMELTEEELVTVTRIQELSKLNSRYGCMPTISIEEYNGQDKERE